MMLQQIKEKLFCNKCKYKCFYSRIGPLPDCNNCGRKKDCLFLPGWGQNTRINCPLWEKEADNGEDTN